MIDIQRWSQPAGLPLENRVAAAEAELERCVQHFRTHGFAAMSPIPEENARWHRIALQGALMIIGRDELLEAEQQRITRQFEASGSFGLTHEEKVERLAELRQRQPATGAA